MEYLSALIRNETRCAAEKTVVYREQVIDASVEAKGKVQRVKAAQAVLLQRSATPECGVVPRQFFVGEAEQWKGLLALVLVGVTRQLGTDRCARDPANRLYVYQGQNVLKRVSLRTDSGLARIVREAVKGARI